MKFNVMFVAASDLISSLKCNKWILGFLQLKMYICICNLYHPKVQYFWQQLFLECMYNHLAVDIHLKTNMFAKLF